MTSDGRPKARADDDIQPRAELSLAKLLSPQTTWEGEVVPAGTTGTIVEVLGQGKAYVLNFVEPYQAVATVEAQQLEERRDCGPSREGVDEA